MLTNDVRERPLRWSRALAGVAALLWIAAFLAYARTTITAIPYIDDWRFIDALVSYLDGEPAAQYLFATHNGHLMAPSRLAVLVSYRWDALRLDAVRWASVAAMFGTAAIYAFLVAGRTRGPWLVAWLPTLLLTVSAAHWELLTVATGFSNMCLPLFVAGSMAALERARTSGSTFWIAVSLATGAAATVSLSAGALVWLALAYQGALAGGRPRAIAVPCAVAGVLAIVITARTAVPSGSFDLIAVVAAVPIIAGTSVLGLLENAPVPAYDAIIGIALVAITLWTLVAASRRSAKQRSEDSASLALLAFGWACVASIAVGRAAYGASAVAASRYAVLAAPIPAALYLYWLGEGRRPLAIGLAGLIVCAQVITNVEEFRMAPHRAAFMAREARGIRCDDLPETDEMLVRTRAHVTPFLRRERLSVFAADASTPCVTEGNR